MRTYRTTQYEARYSANAELFAEVAGHYPNFGTLETKAAGGGTLLVALWGAPSGENNAVIWHPPVSEETERDLLLRCLTRLHGHAAPGITQ